MPDTIVALASPPGRGGLGVVRIAGPDAVRVARTLARRARPFVPRRATLVRLVDETDEGVVDQAIVTWFESPHSYTGDDVVEICGHGSPVVMHRIVSVAMRAGARLAEPGEFTLRAYLNGRLDLAQAEAVADLVNAVTPLQARAAMDQLEGTLTRAIGRVDGALFDLAARLEASLDFPDEGFHFITCGEARTALEGIRRDLDALVADGRTGRMLREGCLVAIVGPPNAGKSSLFNALAGASRAIVTNLPGTTRDLLTECVDIEGLAVTLVDTAGLREPADAIESEGVARARDAQRVAALTLVVFDRSVPPDAGGVAAIGEIGGPVLVVLNKSDRPCAWHETERTRRGAEVVDVSALSGEGLGDLRRRIAATLTGRESLRDPPVISNLRHLALVETASAAVGRASAALADGATEEVALAEMADARRALESVAGRRPPDAVLRHIFERFCVGK